MLPLTSTCSPPVLAIHDTQKDGAKGNILGRLTYWHHSEQYMNEGGGGGGKNTRQKILLTKSEGCSCT